MRELVEITDITPNFWGYNEYPLDDSGKIILPRVEYKINGTVRSVIVIYRKNVIDYGNGLIGLCDSSKIANESWVSLRNCFILEEDDGTQNFHWCVGGSSAGAICGDSAYGNARTEYEKKMSRIINKPDAETQFRYAYGHANEELIARGFATLYDKKVVKNNTVFFREDIGFMQANVDYLVDGLDKNRNPGWFVLEVKSTNPQSNILRDYFKQVPPVAPPHYYDQPIHYCKVLCAAFNIIGFYFAVGYDNALNNIIGIQYSRNTKAEEVLLEKENNFISYLRFQTPPPLTDGNISSEKLEDFFKEHYPVAVEQKTTSLSETAVAALSEYKRLGEEVTAAKKVVDEIVEKQKAQKAIVLQEMADCATSTPFTIDGNDFYLSCKNQERNTVNTRVLKDKFLDVYEQVVQKNSFRRFDIKKAKAVKK